MQIEENKSLKNYNTFGIDVRARYFVSVTSLDALRELLSSPLPKPLFILGGGSNMLLTKDLDAFVIHLNLKGIEILSETDSEVYIKVMAGENWHDFVMYCVERNYGGLENLALIPGNVGTAPIQNIGAYGVELKDTFYSCTALNHASLKNRTFSKKEAQFAYRNSVFKEELKDKYIITEVTFCLTKKNHTMHTTYGDILSVLNDKHIVEPGIKDIAEAVISIRKSKLPDPKVLGNSGSFFKNPILSADTFQAFHSKFPEAPFYKVSPTEVKVPAAWLIEKAGFKGKRFGDAGVHTKQALVLVNHGAASGKELWDLALHIQQEVKDLTQITIEPEVNIF